MKIGICVGHSRRGDSGAESVDGVSEWTYNSVVARELELELDRRGIDSIIVDDYRPSSYAAAIRHCAQILKAAGVTHAIELHFNSAGPSAHGHEWLHWGGSRGGQALAKALEHSFSAAFPAARSRGLKPKKSGDRGSLFLRLTHCPAIIAEPFFGSSQSDWRTFKHAHKSIAAAIANGIDAIS